MCSFWRRVWRCKLPRRMLLHAWRIFHDGLPVLTCLRRRGCVVEGSCNKCGLLNESATHIFLECWWALAVWRELCLDLGSFFCEGLGPADWMFKSAYSLSKEDFRKFLCGLTCLWDNRNAIYHGTEGGSTSDIKRRVEAMIYQMDSLKPTSTNGSSSCNIFCDASWRGGGEAAGLAAVARRQDVVLGVRADSSYNFRSVSEAEGRALVLGMEMAASLNIEAVTFFTDSVEVYSASSKGFSLSGFDKEWLSECKLFLGKFKLWSIECIPRENNSFADALAKKASSEYWRWDSLAALPWGPGLDTLA